MRFWWGSEEFLTYVPLEPDCGIVVLFVTLTFISLFVLIRQQLIAIDNAQHAPSNRGKAPAPWRDAIIAQQLSVSTMPEDFDYPLHSSTFERVGNWFENHVKILG